MHRGGDNKGFPEMVLDNMGLNCQDSGDSINDLESLLFYASMFIAWMTSAYNTGFLGTGKQARSVHVLRAMQIASVYL
jgi:hypothetical protein